MILLNTVINGTGYIIKEDPVAYNGNVCMLFKYESYINNVMIKSDSMINIHEAISKAKEILNAK